MSHDIGTNIILSALGSLLIVVFQGISNKLGKLTESVERLNGNVAVVVTRVDSHEKRIELLEKTKKTR